MKRLAPVLGALVLVGAVVAAVVWQRPEPPPPLSAPLTAIDPATGGVHDRTHFVAKATRS